MKRVDKEILLFTNENTIQRRKIVTRGYNTCIIKKQTGKSNERIVHIMKKKRFTALIISLVLSSATILTVFASTEKSENFYYSNNIDAYVHGYIDFYAGPLLFQDQIWCNVGLYGPDQDCVSAFIVIRKNTDVIKQGRLSYRSKSYSCKGKKVGWGGDYASLTVHYDGKIGMITTK